MFKDRLKFGNKHVSINGAAPSIFNQPSPPSLSASPHLCFLCFLQVCICGGVGGGRDWLRDQPMGWLPVGERTGRAWPAVTVERGSGPRTQREAALPGVSVPGLSLGKIHFLMIKANWAFYFLQPNTS